MCISKRIMTALTVLAVVSAGIFVFSKDAQAAKVVSVMFAGTEADTTPQSQALHEVANRLNKSGLFKVKVFTAGSLSGDTDDLVTQALQGAAIVVPSDPGRISANQKVPEFGILMAPYVLKDYKVLDKLLQTQLYLKWEKDFEKSGLKLVTNNWYNGMRHFVTNKKIDKPSDLKGLRIRGFGNTIGLSLAKALGYAQTSIPAGEIFSAVQTKALDGCEIQIPFTYSNRLYEVLKYNNMTSHYMLTSSIVTGLKFFNSMTKEQQDLFVKTFRDVGTEFQAKVAAVEQDNLKQMEAKGMIINNVDTAPFEKAVLPYYKDMGFSPEVKTELFKQLGIK
ncbi:MAG: TRAP transporter substrate-binding protein DctP [Elusimicrobiota bacterium]|jgi:TRAP-type C4-dicarboxylate transport system substrate-binding protein|nr:TRAP transporter substrate-binding protein DctP [Elusimicrobiota bacterium]